MQTKKPRYPTPSHPLMRAEMSDDQPIIKPTPNGPLVAKNIPILKMSDGTTTHPKKDLYLCRCGGSANMPFCDGTHKKNEFTDSGNKDTTERIYDYVGTDITVHFSKLLCSHAGECGKRARNIFNTKERPWVKPDEGTIEQVKEVVAACPSGALQYSINSEPTNITNEAIEIKVERNGPYQISNIAVDADDWTPTQSEKKYVLCRCGLSKNKPFCDGTHYEHGWREPK